MIQKLPEIDDPISATDGGGAWDAYVWVEDADASFATFVDRDVRVEYEPEDFPSYGMREVAVAGPNGNLIAFGSDLSHRLL